ncbi:D-alanine--D-alanine ligase family protein [soil metagenome]
MKRIGIIFGGANSEHEVSCHSAESVVEHLDRSLFEPVLLGIDRAGGWHLVDAIEDLDTAGAGTRLPDLEGLDVAFPVLHGRFGEDGTIQGLLEMAGLAYVGCGVLSSSLAMDKRLTQRLLEASGIPTIPTRTVTTATAGDAALISKPLGFPLFVKPNRAGSSVGATPVAVESQLTDAVALALEQDAIALIQSSITGDEVAMAVLQRADGSVAVGPPLRVVTGESTAFFDYAAKYTEGGGATLEVPAQIPQQVIERLEAYALSAFETLDCDGLARVDFFVLADGEILLNEVNTMPGFTALSQYPRMWQAAGLSYTDLITELIARAEVARK